MKYLDDFLNDITMYRLMLYLLIFLVAIAALLSSMKLLPFSPLNLLLTTIFLVVVSWLTNTLFAKVFRVPTNLESVYITALILTLILTPAHNLSDVPFLFWAAVLANSSKYMLTIKRKHIFNPAAFAVALTAIALNYSASWWIGTAVMMPFTLVGGLLVVRKIRRADMVFSFFITALVVILGSSTLKGEDLLSTFQKILLDTPILFFAFIMLTEPLTTPSTKKWQIIYGSWVGILFAPFIHIGTFYSTPEIALLMGNIFSYIVSPKEKLLLRLKEKKQIAPDIYDFVFGLSKRLSYVSGQYMEWTYAHKNTDSRGSRRYFTLASSPTEDNLRIGVKFLGAVTSPAYPGYSSSFKKAMFAMNKVSEIVASQLSGEFTMPKNPNQKLCFIAGGIGITPYRSMIKYLLDTGQRRDIILFYSAKTEKDFVYKEIFDEAYRKLGIKSVYVTGRLDSRLILGNVSDYKERFFYISGPHNMVDTFEGILKDMGVRGNQIKTDFFPGYA